MQKRWTVLLTAVFLVSSIGLLWAQQDKQDNSSQVPADNTKVNQRDRSQSEATADQQKETQKETQRTGNSRNKSAKRSSRISPSLPMLTTSRSFRKTGP